jgi:hypothetical protein
MEPAQAAFLRAACVAVVASGILMVGFVFNALL